jgi:hypothetical protein
MSADPFVRGVLISELIRIVLPLAVLVWLTLIHHFWRAWPALVAATVASSGLGILLWYVFGLVRSGAS